MGYQGEHVEALPSGASTCSLQGEEHACLPAPTILCSPLSFKLWPSRSEEHRQLLPVVLQLVALHPPTLCRYPVCAMTGSILAAPSAWPWSNGGLWMNSLSRLVFLLRCDASRLFLEWRGGSVAATESS